MDAHTGKPKCFSFQEAPAVSSKQPSCPKMSMATKNLWLFWATQLPTTCTMQIANQLTIGLSKLGGPKQLQMCRSLRRPECSLRLPGAVSKKTHKLTAQWWSKRSCTGSRPAQDAEATLNETGQLAFRVTFGISADTLLLLPVAQTHSISLLQHLRISCQDTSNSCSGWGGCD